MVVYLARKHPQHQSFSFVVHRGSWHTVDVMYKYWWPSVLFNPNGSYFSINAYFVRANLLRRYWDNWTIYCSVHSDGNANCSLGRGWRRQVPIMRPSGFGAWQNQHEPILNNIKAHFTPSGMTSFLDPFPKKNKRYFQIDKRRSISGKNLHHYVTI